MEKIGFFGGCFNPVNNIHIEIAQNLIKQGKVNKIVFIPMNDFYKKEKLIEANHRYNMLKLGIKQFSNLEVDDIEIKENKLLYATDAFELIAEKYLDTGDLFFIMGSDNFQNMSKWKDYSKIKDKYNYIVIKRDKNVISSTKIRQMIKNNDDTVVNYLPLEVYKYILENKLYEL